MTVWRAAVVTVLLAMTLQCCWGYKCYICSWSPRSGGMDNCTTSNFVPESIIVHDYCIHGCEAVAVYDLEGALNNFYRNCLPKDKPVLDDCLVEDFPAYKKRSCRCISDLCNAASDITMPVVLLIAALVSLALRKTLG